MVTTRVGGAGTDYQEGDWGGFPEKVTLDFLGITVLNKESGLNSSETSKDPESGRKGIETEESETETIQNVQALCFHARGNWARVKDGPEKAMAPTPVLLPGKSYGWRSLVSCSPWGR